MVLKNSHFHFSKDPRYIKLDSLLSLVQVTLSSLTHECCCCHSVAKLCPTLCNALDCSMPVLHSLARRRIIELSKYISIELVMLSNHLILCHLILLPSNFPSIRVFSNESALCIRWPKYWSFTLSISPSNQSPEYSGLISFRIDWVDLLAVQGTLKSLLQHCSSKPSIIPCSAFFMVQLS